MDRCTYSPCFFLWNSFLLLSFVFFFSVFVFSFHFSSFLFFSFLFFSFLFFSFLFFSFLFFSCLVLSKLSPKVSFSFTKKTFSLQWFLEEKKEKSSIWKSKPFSLQFQFWDEKRSSSGHQDLTVHNWQKWKRRFLICLCHEIYRVEAVGLSFSNRSNT